MSLPMSAYNQLLTRLVAAPHRLAAGIAQAMPWYVS